MGKKVFVVDDEKEIVDIYAIILGRMGLELSGSVLNGDDAIAALRGRPERPDLVIMDHRMPDKDGLDVMLELLKGDPKLRVLFVSADLSIRTVAKDMGAVGFLPKPFSFQGFVRAVQDALAAT
jgi:two-component system chemotaxis response regulator CheY